MDSEPYGLLMPIKPPPIKNICSNCGWSKNTYLRSDAMRIGVDVFTSCPKCRSDDIKYALVSKDNEDAS